MSIEIGLCATFATIRQAATPPTYQSQLPGLHGQSPAMWRDFAEIQCDVRRLWPKIMKTDKLSRSPKSTQPARAGLCLRNWVIPTRRAGGEEAGGGRPGCRGDGSGVFCNGGFAPGEGGPTGPELATWAPAGARWLKIDGAERIRNHRVRRPPAAPEAARSQVLKRSNLKRPLPYPSSGHSAGAVVSWTPKMRQLAKVEPCP